MFGRFIQSLIYFWLNLTGKKLDPKSQKHLLGPMGMGQEIGEDYYKKLAERENLMVSEPADAGLMTNFDDVLDHDDPYFSRVDSGVRDFYEQSARYYLEIWPKWIAPISWFARIIIKLISEEIMQLNIPLDSLETSYGMSSRIIKLKDDKGNLHYTCWLRKSEKMNKVVYAGFYSATKIDSEDYKYVRVVFPLPKGNVTVILKVEIQEDGSVKLISNSGKYSKSGYFRIHQSKRGLKYRKVPVHEMIHVFRDEKGVMRTDHFFSWWNLSFLKLHYKLIKGK